MVAESRSMAGKCGSCSFPRVCYTRLILSKTDAFVVHGKRLREEPSSHEPGKALIELAALITGKPDILSLVLCINREKIRRPLSQLPFTYSAISVGVSDTSM